MNISTLDSFNCYYDSEVLPAAMASEYTTEKEKKESPSIEKAAKVGNRVLGEAVMQPEEEAISPQLMIAMNKLLDGEKGINVIDGLNKAERIAIAKKEAELRGWEAASTIKSYLIDDEDVHVEIAKIIAVQKDGGIPLYIKSFNIKSEQARIEIAKIAAAHNGCSLMHHLGNFKITDKQALFEIAIIAANTEGCVGVLFSFERCGIKEVEKEVEFYLTALRASLEKDVQVSSAFRYFNFLESMEISSLLKCPLEINRILSEYYLNNETDLVPFRSFLERELLEKSHGSQERISNLLNQIIHPNTVRWCASLALYLLSENCSRANLEILLESGLLEEIGNYHEPKIRFDLLKWIPDLLNNRDVREEFIAKANEEKSTRKRPHKIIALYYALLKKQGIDAESLDRMVLYSSDHFYKNDAVKQKKLIQALQIVLGDTLLNPEKKILLFQYLFPEGMQRRKKEQTSDIGVKVEESYNEIRALAGLAGLLKLESFKTTPEHPSILLEKAFLSSFSCDNVSDFQQQVDRKITTSRNPAAALIYAGTLNKLPRKEKMLAFTAYRKFINWWLNDTYKQNRYDLNLQSEHLRTLFFKKRSGLFEEWKKGDGITLKDLIDPNQELEQRERASLVGFNVVDTDDPLDMLLSGTEGSSSCQRIDGPPVHCKGLVAALLDGKIRLLAVKNENGLIVARGLLRLMQRSDNQEPVLLLESIYSDGSKKHFKEGILALAKKRAEILGLPLLSVSEACELKYDCPIISQGSCAPFEYSDSCKGIKPNGVYSIDSNMLSVLYSG